MGLRELLILVLILAIIGVVLRGLYVAMSSRRNQIRVALDRNIPEYDLEELELRELPNGGARMVERSFARVVENNRQQDAREAARASATSRSSGGRGTMAAALRRPVQDWQAASSGVRTVDRGTGQAVEPSGETAADLPDNIPTLTERFNETEATPAGTDVADDEIAREEPHIDESFAELAFGSPRQDEHEDWSVAQTAEPEPRPEAAPEFEPELEPEPELETALETAAGLDAGYTPDPEALATVETASEAQLAAELRALARQAVTPVAEAGSNETDSEVEDDVDSAAQRAEQSRQHQHDIDDERGSLDSQIFVDDFSPDDDDEDYDDDMDTADDGDSDDDDEDVYDNDYDDFEEEYTHNEQTGDALTQSSWLDEAPEADTDTETDAVPPSAPAEARPEAGQQAIAGPETLPPQALVTDADDTPGNDYDDEDVMASGDAEQEAPTYYYYSGGPWPSAEQESASDSDVESDADYEASELADEEEIWDQSEVDAERDTAPATFAMSDDASRDIDDIDVLLDGYEDERNQRLEALQAQQEKAGSRLAAWAGATMGKAGSLLRGRRERKAELTEQKASEREIQRAARREEREQRKAAAAAAAARQQELALDEPSAVHRDDAAWDGGETRYYYNDAELDPTYKEPEPAPAHDEATTGLDGESATAQDADYSEVLVVNVMAREGEDIIGEELLPVLMSYGLRFGDMNIFHRHAGGKQGPVVFSVANILNPGTFDLNQISDFTTKGLCFFLALPSVIDNMKAFDQMLATAAHVAEALDAELKDDYRSVMTAQTVEHYREQIHNFELRQLRRGR